jgi:hypothetical protein
MYKIKKGSLGTNTVRIPFCLDIHNLADNL